MVKKDCLQCRHEGKEPCISCGSEFENYKPLLDIENDIDDILKILHEKIKGKIEFEDEKYTVKFTISRDSNIEKWNFVIGKIFLYESCIDKVGLAHEVISEYKRAILRNYFYTY